MTKWHTSILGCLDGNDAGLTCTLQHLFCQPCVWASALARAGVEESALLGCFVCCGGRGLIDEAAGYVGRRALVEKYKIDESTAMSCLLACACAPCARCQEVDMVLEHENGRYGCAQIVDDTVRPVAAVPVGRRVVSRTRR